MVPQSYGIWPHMTVLDNAAFPLRHGRNRKGQLNIKQRTLEMLDQVGLAPYADRWSTQLSGGQQQRLALARALLSEPEVLLLDEPLSNLDAKLRAKLRLELRAFQEQFGVTSVYVTHDQAEALALSDIVVVMNQGRIEQIDRPNGSTSSRSPHSSQTSSAAPIWSRPGSHPRLRRPARRTDIGTFLCAGRARKLRRRQLAEMSASGRRTSKCTLRRRPGAVLPSTTKCPAGSLEPNSSETGWNWSSTSMGTKLTASGQAGSPRSRASANPLLHG
jgi:iron(III) transport system ATP-binding protein